MKKLLILPMLIGLCACKEQPNVSVDLRCSNGNVENPYDNFGFDVFDDAFVLKGDGGVELKIPFAGIVDEAFSHDYGTLANVDISIDKGQIEYVIINNGSCDVVVPLGTEFTASCVHNYISAQIFNDYVLLSVDGGDQMKLPLVKSGQHDDMGIVYREYLVSDTGWGLDVFGQQGHDSVYEIHLKKPEFNNAGVMAYGCNVYIPLK